MACDVPQRLQAYRQKFAQYGAGLIGEGGGGVKVSNASISMKLWLFGGSGAAVLL